MSIPKSLVEDLARGDVVPFVGSGVSLSVKPGLFPTWAQLLQSMAGLWRLEPSLVVTTNYENVLGWAGPPSVRVLNSQKAELAELYRSASPEKPRIWHLHGHVDRLAYDPCGLAEEEIAIVEEWARCWSSCFTTEDREVHRG